MKVSVVMATYNGTKHIKEQLESIVLQTIPPDEIIVFDDCSTDGTSEFILAEAAEHAVPIILYQQKVNVGYTRNFSDALMRATGDIIFLSDQDDIWMKHKISLMLDELFKSSKMIAICDAELVDENLQSQGVSKMSQLMAIEGTLDNHVMGCCIAVKRKFLQEVLPVPLHFRGHDNWLMNVAKTLDLVLYIEESLQFYRRHSSNVSQIAANSVFRVRKISAFQSLFREFFSLVKGDHDFNNADLQRNILYDFVRELHEKSDDLEVGTKFIELERQVGFAKKRAFARSLPFFSRLSFVIKSLIAGLYIGKRGVRSAIADLMVGSRS